MAERACGILLHPTSLPSGDAVACLGEPARRWLGWLETAGQGLWQVLPLGPPDAGGSPYGSASAFAGDPRLIDFGPLAERGLVHGAAPGTPAAWREAIGQARATLRGTRDPLEIAYREWASASEQRSWLDDWSLFAAIKLQQQERAWIDWPEPLRDRQPAALAAARAELGEEIDRQGFAQFLYWSQWRELRQDARRRGIRIIGDLPIYMALDCADVWSRRELFALDAAGRPLELGGVPPDAFSQTGQLWGHPLYRWDRLRETGYAWWIERLRAAASRADAVRIDHFRAFAAGWQVPAGAADAAGGRWVAGPGRAPFDAAAEALGPIELIAEDLGQIDDEVRQLRDDLDMPGMAVLQFGFGSESGDSEHLPHRYRRRQVAYTGTHDNDTARGWYEALDDATRGRVDGYLAPAAGEIHWAMIRAVLSSVADRAILPLQDVLGLGSEARLNTPGTAAGNWHWRCPPGALSGEIAGRLRRLTELTGRAATGGETSSDPRP